MNVPAAVGRGWLRTRRAIELLWTAVRLGASPLFRRVLHLGEPRPTAPVRLRLAMEHLGVTYVKLGQYLAMRFDVLPPEICRELGRLFESVEPMPPGVVASVIEDGLGRPADQLFADFSAAPIASASIAQVHEARTFDGNKVAVKVQRRGIEPILQADTANLRALTRAVDAFHLLGRLSATEMLDQFTEWTFREVDFVLEGRTAEEVGKGALDFEKIPAVRWDLTCPVVLTLEFIDGTSLAQVLSEVDNGGAEKLAEKYPDLNVDLVLHNLTFASLSQIFVRGLFHGDPHPGNVMVLKGNRVAFVDFGIFGVLRPFDQQILSGQIENLAVGRIDESLRFYQAQLSVTDESDLEGFRREARKVLQTWYDVSLRTGAALEDQHIGKYIGQMIDISRRYRLRYDMSYLLYWRALNALDSTSLRLSPGFDLVAQLRQFFAGIRPGPLARLASAVRDPRWLGAVADLASTESPLVRQLVARARDGWPVDRYSVSGAAQAGLNSSGWVLRLSGALTSLSLLVLALRIGTGPVTRDVGAVAALAVLSAALAVAARS